AASSGQEAYSLAMICKEEGDKLQGWKVEIVGTDLSREMITRAKSGTYTQFEVQRGLPIRMLVKYLQQLNKDKWQIKDEIRRMVQFGEGNLLDDFGPIGTFDVIYCRHVLMHFDEPTRAHVLESLHGMLAPDGALILGVGEAANDKFKPLEGQS